MRRIILLLLVILVIAAIADAHRKSHRKHKSKKHHSKKSGYRTLFRSRYPGKKTKNIYRKVSRVFTHKQTYKVSHKVSINYNFNIKHNYKSEVHCSKHCVPDKAYWHGDHCLCHAGLAGAGDLCCTDPKEYEYTCTVRGDPYVHSYLGQNATVFNPCGQVLAVINAKTSSRQSCHVTVRSADVIEQGIFVTNQVEVSYAISGRDSEYVILDGYRYYNSLESKWVDLGSDYSKCFSIHGERVQVLQDKHRRVWTIAACGTIINFRRDTRGGKPGVCVSSKYPYSSKKCDQPTDNVCNRLTSRHFGEYNSHATYYLAKSFERKEYKNLRLSCAYRSLCKTVTTTFNQCCPARRAAAINACAAILQRDFRQCAYMRDGLDGAKLFEMFSKCLKAYCDGDQQWCYTEKASSTVLHCSLPQLQCCDFKRGGGGQQQVVF